MLHKLPGTVDMQKYKTHKIKFSMNFACGWFNKDANKTALGFVLNKVIPDYDLQEVLNHDQLQTR